ncbi:MAG TPA: hypothetical protein VGJ84_09460 [Polyangiaceae bacterium]
MTELHHGHGPAWGARAVLLLLPFATFACSSQAPELRRQVNSLEGELRRIQGENDRLEERVSTLEQHLTARGKRAGATSESPTPPLKVVRLDPDTSTHESIQEPTPADSSTEDDGPRALIRGRGDRLESVQLPGSAKGRSSSGGEPDPSKERAPPNISRQASP